MMLVRDPLYDSLLDECEQAIKMGNGTGCYIEKVLNRQEELGLSRKDISSVYRPAETNIGILIIQLEPLGSLVQRSWMQGQRRQRLSYRDLCWLSCHTQNANNAFKERSIQL
jgi:hypothetical protein